MRMTRLVTKTLRTEPTEAETVSHRLMLKAGMILQVAAGVYDYLPLALRSMNKISAIVRQEMDAAGGQELRMPTLQPLEVWQETDRAAAFGQELFTLTDRHDRRLVLGPTHEELITLIVRQYVQSYRDLPLNLYQIQTKFRDQARPRGGLLRTREFDMKDAYTFDADEEGLDRNYQRMAQAYMNIFSRCGVQAIMVEADSGAIGGKDSHEFIVLAPSGEDTVLICPHCGYGANAERAQGRKRPNPPEQPLPLEEVSTPGIKTIRDLAAFLGVPESKTLKAVFYMADGQMVFATIRGDLEINEVKLKNMLKVHNLRLASPEEVAQAGLVAGSASPIGLKDIKRVADDSIMLGTNFVVGANKPDTHMRNANYPRDFQVDQMGDIALAQAGQGCPRCQGTLKAERGIEVGHIFKLGTAFSQKLGAYFLDREGQQRPVIMGCFGIGIGRLLAAAIEQNHDDKGIIFPMPIAPFQVHLLGLNLDNPEVAQAADRLYQSLQEAGLEVLYDDRTEESAGVKFNDADLLGLPVRLVVSPRNLRQGSVEMKLRRDKESRLVPLAEVVASVRAVVQNGLDSQKAVTGSPYTP